MEDKGRASFSLPGALEKPTGGEEEDVKCFFLGQIITESGGSAG